MKLIEYAIAAGRDYITPEDCEDAVLAGKDTLELFRERWRLQRWWSSPTGS